MKVEDEDLRRELEIALEGHDTISGCIRRLGLSQTEFKNYVYRARVHGIEAVLHSNRARGYTDGFKLSVVHSVIEEKLSWTAAGIRFNLRRDLIKSWVGKYLTGGEEKLKRENLLLKKQGP